MGFSQALSGLNAAKANLDTLGNNIANSQTVGFKSSNTLFADVFANADVGLGTQVSSVLQDFSEGNLEATNRELDLAVSGEGFFRLQQNGETVYSRNGQMTMDAEGYLVNAQGARLMGYGVNGAGEVQVGGQPTVLQVSAESLAASATTSVSNQLNFDAREVAGEGLNQAQVSTNMPNLGNGDSQETLDYHYSNNFTVYDSLGEEHSVSIYYEKRPEAENSWLAKVVMDDYYVMRADEVGRSAGTIAEYADDMKNVVGVKGETIHGQLDAAVAGAKGELDELQTNMRDAADNAVTGGGDADEVRQAVNDVINNFTTSSGSTLSAVLEQYLNNGAVDSEQDALLAAYADKVKTEMKGETTGADVKDAVDGFGYSANLSDAFGEFFDKKAASVVAGFDQQYADVASEMVTFLKGKVTANDIDATVTDINDVIQTDIEGSGELWNQVKAFVTAPADGVDGLDASGVSSATKLTGLVGAAQALADGNPEDFEAYGTNDFLVEFDASGSLRRVGVPRETESGGVEYVDADNKVPSISFASNQASPLGGAAEDLNFTIGLNGSTQFSNDSQVNELSQNGYTSGALVGIEIEDDGTIVRNFSNEQSQAAGQIALANFRNPEGLKAAGDNAWTETAASGGELVGQPGTGVLGSVTAGAVETSNVDMASELVDMIVAQRAYQANSQTIKVQDEILQSAVNLR